jgi:hypothetical protein
VCQGSVHPSDNYTEHGSFSEAIARVPKAVTQTRSQQQLKEIQPLIQRILSSSHGDAPGHYQFRRRKTLVKLMHYSD